MNLMRAAAVVFGSLVALLVSPLPAGATHRVIHVRPGPQAISQAIDLAHGGDVIVIHEGRYPEHVVVDKRLRLRAAAGDTPVIDGKCSVLSTVEIDAHGVVIRGLKVVGGSYYEVDVRFVNNVTIRDTRTRDTCEDALYGINVFNTGSVLVAGGRARGFSDAGVYIGSLDHGTTVVRGIELLANNRGIIVEEVLPGVVRVVGNHAHDNRAPGLGPPSGIWLNEADGTQIVGNRVQDNEAYGIHLDDLGSSSDDNVVRDNTVMGSGDLDILDEGSGNCFSGNVVGTSDPPVLPPC